MTFKVSPGVTVTERSFHPYFNPDWIIEQAKMMQEMYGGKRSYWIARVGWCSGVGTTDYVEKK